MSAAPAQYLLTPERQACLDGWLEPLVDASGAPPGLPELPPSPERQMFLRLEAEAPQLPLPLPTRHPLKDGKPCPSCVTGWGTHQCPDHPDEGRVTPRLCGRQACESSRDANDRERARDVWDGTGDVPVGMRHLLREGVALGVFVFPLPYELRRLCQGELVGLVRAQAWEMSVEVMERHGGGPGLRLWGREYLHPVGEPALPRAGEPEPDAAELDGTDYKPHSNVLVPLVGLTAAGTLWRGRPMLPPSWMGKRGWVMARWRERLVSVFGQWWPEGEEPPEVVWWYEPREGAEEQGHALRYFARVFPAWAGRKSVSVRPRARGLSNGRKRAERARLVGLLDARCGPVVAEFSTCPHSTPERPCPEPVVFGASTEGRVRELVRRLPGIVVAGRAALALPVRASSSILNNGESCGRSGGPWPTAPPVHVETGPPVWSLPVPTGFP